MSGKRKYKSETQKRTDKKKKTDSCLSNTSLISTFMRRKDEIDNKLAENSENPFDIAGQVEENLTVSELKQDPVSAGVAEVDDDSILNSAEKDLNPLIPPTSNHGVTDDNSENYTPFKLRFNLEAKSDNNKHLVFDATREFPTDRGHFVENITDRDLKMQIMHHGSCRPTGCFEHEDEQGNAEVNFSAKYYNKYIDNVSIPRLWLCCSMELRKPYCEVC